MALNLDFLNEETEITNEMKQFIQYFMKNTTDKIFARMERLDIHNTGALRNSIHAVVYNNSGGNEALVRFYFLNYARFIEMGLGRNYVYDSDLKGEGVKVRNVDIPPITSQNYGPLDVEMKGSTNSGIQVGPTWKTKNGRMMDRASHHKARPFLMNSIKYEVERISQRMAEQFTYTHTVYMANMFMTAFGMKEADELWLKNQGFLEELRTKMHTFKVK